MRKFIQRLINRLPKYYKNIWYNRSHWIEKEIYPKVFDEKGIYIDCRIGIKVLMGQTKSGRGIYYEVFKIKHKRGSDWLYPSDAIDCDLKFSHLSEKGAKENGDV